MAVVGLGVDLVQIDRIARLRKKFSARFLDRVFHPGELQDCLDRPNPDMHLAARFAAKEALGKALRRGIFQLRFSDIQVASESDGCPSLRLHGRVAELCSQREITKVHLTLSHEGDYALAVVVLEGKGNR